MVIFTKKFRTLDPHLPIVWDKVLKKNGFFFDTFPYDYDDYGDDNDYDDSKDIFIAVNMK